MYCVKCGKYNDREDALFCPFCGTHLTNQNTNYQTYSNDPFQNYQQNPYPNNAYSQNQYTQKPSMALVVLGFIIPIVGFVLFFVFRKKQPLTSKYCGLAGLAGFLFNFVVMMLSV